MAVSATYQKKQLKKTPQTHPPTPPPHTLLVLELLRFQILNPQHCSIHSFDSYQNAYA